MKKTLPKSRTLTMVFLFAVIIFSGIVNLYAEEPAKPNTSLPSVSDMMNIIDKATSEDSTSKDFSTPIKLVMIFTALAILPSVLVMMTSFTRIVIVLGFVRRALTTQNIPPTIAIIGLALFLTLFTMTPTIAKIKTTAIEPYMAEKIDLQKALDNSTNILKQFMLGQCKESDLELFVQMSHSQKVSKPQELGLHVVVPAFIISEFRTAFQIGCLVFIPFLLIDLVVANILLSAGMMMLPPVMISLPLKIILFVLVDGWAILAQSLSMGFQ